MLEVSNNGSKPTTITNICLFGYKGRLGVLLGRTDKQAIVIPAADAPQAPHLLNVGERFMTHFRQTEGVEEWSRDQLLYLAVYHSFSNKPTKLRIDPIHKTEGP
jgi:hypothetical protein